MIESSVLAVNTFKIRCKVTKNFSYMQAFWQINFFCHSELSFRPKCPKNDPQKHNPTSKGRVGGLDLYTANHNIDATRMSNARLMNALIDSPACLANAAIALCVSGLMRIFNCPE